MDITIKNEDNHETNMLSSDDYNAYHGGMIAAVRSIKGSAPKSYCGDSTDRSRVTMHSVQEEAKRLFRSEAINPKFIEGMMKHGYKGAADMSNMVAHSYQWDATSKVMEGMDAGRKPLGPETDNRSVTGSFPAGTVACKRRNTSGIAALMPGCGR